jgi:effector-binding domain-containing protein
MFLNSETNLVSVVYLRRFALATQQYNTTVFLLEFREELLARAERAKDQADKVMRFIRSQEADMYEVTVIEQPDIQALTVTQSTSDKEQVGSLVVEGFNHYLWPLVKEKQINVQPPSLFICNEEDRMKTQIIVGIASEEHIEDERVKTLMLPGGKFLRTLHQGSYADLGGAYQAILHYAQKNNMPVLEETREVYLVDYTTTNDDHALRTEVLYRLKG